MGLFDLDKTVFVLTDADGEKSDFKLRDAFEGIQIFGGIGSGKTSGSGRMIALKYLQAGFGGLVLTAKPDEKEMWEKYCSATGRENDLIIVEPNGKHFFNFLDYESKSKDGNISYTENIVHLLKTVINASAAKEKSQSDDAFWESALDMLMSHAIELCMLAFGKIRIEDLFAIVQGAPNGSSLPEGNVEFQKIYDAADNTVNKAAEKWASFQSQELQHRFQQESDFYTKTVVENVSEARTFMYIYRFFKQNYKFLSEKTRSIVEFSFSGFLFSLLRDPVHSLFCKNTTNFSPLDCIEGKIILLNLPVKVYHKVGRDSQILFKYIWQRSMEKRNISINNRPVFLWSDESQNFLHEHDAVYQATARSSRISTVYISQNLPNYHANMGGGKSEYKVQGFLGTLGTKIFHANADIETNKYASDLIGDGDRKMISVTTSVTDGKATRSETESRSLQRRVRPEALVTLLTGGSDNAFDVQAYVHKQGNGFSNGKNFIIANFNQNTNY